MLKTLGSTLIVAGTAIGAGMLAMPIAAAGNGLIVSFIMLVVLWALMCCGALLMTEAYQHVSPDMGLASLARQYCGRSGKFLASSSMMLLQYALIAAYISGAGEIIVSLLERLHLQLPAALAVIIAALVGGTIVVLGTGMVDRVNRLLFAFMLIFLTLILYLLMAYVDSAHVVTAPAQPWLIFAAIPVIFTSFGFHGSIPSIIKYMDGNQRQLRLIFILGSAIPLLAYALWQLATLGSIRQDVFMRILAADGGLGSLLDAIQATVSSPVVMSAAQVFMSLALATSFLGVALGLFDFQADFFHRKDTIEQRLQTGLITFLPPLAFALFYPRGFVMALGYAAIFLAVIALILPSMIVYRLRREHAAGARRVAGGNLTLAIAFGSGLGIIAIQLAVILRLLPDIG